jgi:hypothetical protein
MNDGVQRDYGQVKVSVHLDDNPDLAANNYTAEFILETPVFPFHRLGFALVKSE